jgi:hypothetical protein
LQFLGEEKQKGMKKHTTCEKGNLGGIRGKFEERKKREYKTEKSPEFEKRK